LAAPSRLDADEHHAGSTDERGEHADRVAPTAHASEDRVGVSALDGSELLARLVADHALQISDERWERVWPGSGAEYVMGLGYRCGPIAHRLVDRFLQGPLPRRHRHHLRAEELHPGDVRRLTMRILLAHVHDAGQAEQRCGGRSRPPVLPGTRP